MHVDLKQVGIKTDVSFIKTTLKNLIKTGKNGKMIEFNTAPEGGHTTKWIADGGEGMRGFLLSTNEDKTEGVVLALMGSFEGDVKWGRMYLVQEDDPDHHPRQIKQVRHIPENHNLTRLKEDER